MGPWPTRRGHLSFAPHYLAAVGICLVLPHQGRQYFWYWSQRLQCPWHWSQQPGSMWVAHPAGPLRGPPRRRKRQRHRRSGWQHRSARPIDRSKGHETRILAEKPSFARASGRIRCQQRHSQVRLTGALVLRVAALWTNYVAPCKRLLMVHGSAPCTTSSGNHGRLSWCMPDRQRR